MVVLKFGGLSRTRLEEDPRRSRLLAALLQDRGTPAEWIDARQVVRTNGAHGAATPDLDAANAASALGRLHDGFLGLSTARRSVSCDVVQA